MNNINREISNNLNIFNIKLEKVNDTSSNSNRIIHNKSKIKNKELNKNINKNKNYYKKFISKNNFDNNKSEKSYNLEMKKILTHKIFNQGKDLEDDNSINEILNKDNKNIDFKIKVRKVSDINELTNLNLVNDNTNTINKNLINDNHPIILENNPDIIDSESINVNLNRSKDVKFIDKVKMESDYKLLEKKKKIEDKDKPRVKQRKFPIFKNSFILNENFKYNDDLSRNRRKSMNENLLKLEIETLPYLKYSEINSLDESYKENYLTLSLKKHSSKILNQNICEFNLNKDENPISNEEPKIKETFSLFLQNNSKKEFIIDSNYDDKKDSIRNLSERSNNTKIKITKQNENNKKELNDAIKNKSNVEFEKNIILKFSKDFESPQKNKMKISKTKNIFSYVNKNVNINELNQKVTNYENILYCVENNKKLKSEVDILNEKIKTLKKIQNTKNHEIEILKQKYSEAIENYKKEIEKNKELKHHIDMKDKFEKILKKNFKNLINNLIEITELLLLNKVNTEKRPSAIAAENASLSMDIYDSYNNEEERRGILQEQIQTLLISKLNHFKKQLQLNLNGEIERIKNWNSNINYFGGKTMNNYDFNVSNIRLSIKYNENDSFESSKKNISQDYFDSSISNQFLNFNNIASSNFGNNINININQSPKFIFTNNNYNSTKQNGNNSFVNIEGENENIFGSNSNNIHINTNPNVNTNSLNNMNKNSIHVKLGSNLKKKRSNNINMIFNKEEQQEINNCSLNNINYYSNAGNYNSINREERIKFDSINNLISGVNNNKVVGLSSNYNSNSNNIYDSFLQSAKGPNDSFSNSANDSILQIVNLNNNYVEKEYKVISKLNKNTNEIDLINDISPEYSIKKINQINLKDQINKIQNDSYNFIFEESKAKSENYNSDNEIKNKLISDDLTGNNNMEIEYYKDNFSEKNDGKVKLKKMFSFEL